jgi:glycosyltransferase involved in cell wall biosynthesis
MRLDIVIPAHNEEQRIDRTLRAYRAVVNEPLARFIVALDRCTDSTADVVAAHSTVDSRVELLNFPKLGKGGVLMESFRACDAELIGFVDADCATPPAEFLRLVDAAADADGAIASRIHPAAVLPVRRPLGRRLASHAFAAMTRAMFGLPFADTQCGAKVLHRQVVQQALPLLSSRDFLFDVDLLLTAARLGYRIVEVPTVWVDQSGSHVRPVTDAKQMAASSLRLWIHHRVLPVPSPNEGREGPAARIDRSGSSGVGGSVEKELVHGRR